MLDKAISEFLVMQRSRPLGVAVVVLSLFAPAFLVIFLSKAHFLRTYGLHAVFLMSVAISFPIVTLCYTLNFTF